MKLVVDSNVLFTFFWKNSVFSNIVEQRSDFVAPGLVLEEIKKYKQELLTKTAASPKEFDQLLQELLQRVEIIPLATYRSYFDEVKLLAKNFSDNDKDEFLKDADLFALALKLKCPIWSNDRLLGLTAELSDRFLRSF